MEDGEVKIDTKLDTSGLNEGLKGLKVKLNSLGVETEKETKKEEKFNEELDKTADAAKKSGDAVEKAAKKNKNLGDILKDIKGKINGTTVAGIAAAAAIKKTVEVLNDCAAAYRTQANAEEALQIAAKNNPYLNEENVYNLQKFASALQSFSEIGDEVSMQIMAQLAATGRTENEIMQIMQASADMAAATGQDIGSVAQQLNATYNGNAGALGRQISAINNLTKEELENGRAIELVAQQYKGMAAATADVEVQLSNAWGDFKENIGRGWQNVTQPVKQFFLDVLNNINEATAKTNAIKDAGKKDTTGTATAADKKILLDDAQARLSQLQEINKRYVKEVEKTTKSLEELQAEWDAQYGKMSPRMRRDSGAPMRPTAQTVNATNTKGGAYLKAAAQENEKEIARLEKETETDLELAKLDEKYEKGEMSEEQYYEKQKAIKRKAAQEEYKIQMFQWTASILAATANIAEGVSKAIAQGGTAGLITGALVGAAGAVQIASIIASKPVPPQFYAGGIIGGANGASMGSDNTYIHARGGEMVLNADQQRSLWDIINGMGSRQPDGLNLTVNNTQANRVDADVREQDGEVFIDILDKHINKGFTDGTYDAGLAAMNTRQEGVRIL
ncbi:unnamed protein product [Cylicocyclus nassatus]|uniref:Uncharacterized protein n=1 Tax=Cylicocyclus nassatus TaxID=53992 RepID=A0AA36DS31_CYLNA|nr:unnamed protein product [Cylicocyclus nassatus]